MQTTYLIGSDDVKRAARDINTSAEEIKLAASTISYALERHERFMEDWLGRLEAVMNTRS